jgi:lysophospholipase L1-like esterase
MKKVPHLFLLAAVSFAFLTTTESFAQTTNLATNAVLAVTNAVVENTATNPVPRDPRWVTRHEGFVKQAQQGGIDILFMGDSITDFWHDRAAKIWDQYYAPRHAANFGISGDRTEHVLWRINNGELDGIKPKVIVLMIGTNNTGKDRNGQLRNTIPQIIAGVTAVVNEFRAQLPDSKILLLGIFPRGIVDDFQRGEVAVINTAIAKLDDGKMVKFLDIGSNFLEADGTLPRSIMPDLLHPNAKGYQIWADAMNPTLDEMLK